MTSPWDLTPAQRLQIREAHAEAKRREMEDGNAPDPVAAYLAEVRHDWDTIGSNPLRHFSRLLAAAERVLKLANMLEPQAPASSALEEDRMWVRQECADMIRNTVTAALLGKGDDDA